MEKFTGRKLASDLKLYSDFLGWRNDLNRYETWEEACEDVFENTHAIKYNYCIDELRPYLNYAKQLNKEKYFLASQRTLQFRGEDIFKHNLRVYNCTVAYADKASFIGNAFYLLLCGCGVGVNMMLPFVNRLPKLVERNKGTKTYIIQDNIEGWSYATHALISSYLEKPIVGFEEYQGYKLKFDYSLIRPKGSKVGRRFKAPGHEAFKNSIEKVENLLDNYVEINPKPFKSILAYDIFMHLSDAVLSGGVRRSSASIILSPEDNEMVNAKVGNWRKDNPQRARSNNSVGLLRGKFSKEEFEYYLNLTNGQSDLGFVFMNNIFENLNPCFEIGFTALYFDYTNKDLVNRIMNSDITVLDEGVQTGIQCCNLNEQNGAKLKTKEDLFKSVEAAAITGTLQAGYTDFSKLVEVAEISKKITEKEALLGISITGWCNSPWLFNAEILQEAAEIAKKTNEKIAKIIGINPSARITTVKPSGNSSVILQCASGIHPEHSKRYFRVIALNKETETAKWLEENMPFLIEEYVYNPNRTDWCVFLPIENEDGTLYKNDLQGIQHLELIKLVKENWVNSGKTKERCIIPTTSHNVSNTVIKSSEQEKDIADYIFDNQWEFSAVSFISLFGDKDWNQAPNTSVLSFQEIYDKYGEGSLFASGLIVDGLHAFNNNLWNACDHILDKNLKFEGSRIDVFIKKDWVRRAKKFSKNYFKNNLQEMIYCLKDVHLLHKWKTVQRELKPVDFTQILTKPSYVEIDTIGAISCAGGACEVNF